MAILRLCCKAHPAPPPAEQVGFFRRGGRRKEPPPLQPAQPQARCGGRRESHCSLESAHCISLPSTHFPGLRGALARCGCESGSEGPARMAFPPSGHPGGKRPAFRRSVRGKSVHRRCPAPELSESKPLSCPEEFNSVFSVKIKSMRLRFLLLPLQPKE